MEPRLILMTEAQILALLEAMRLARDFQIDRTLGWAACEELDELFWRLEKQERVIGQG